MKSSKPETHTTFAEAPVMTMHRDSMNPNKSHKTAMNVQPKKKKATKN